MVLRVGASGVQQHERAKTPQRSPQQHESSTELAQQLSPDAALHWHGESIGCASATATAAIVAVNFVVSFWIRCTLTFPAGNGG